jgi:hypothetical protein
MSTTKHFQFTGEAKQLAALRREKFFSLTPTKNQLTHNRYQQYLTSSLELNGKSFGWDANTFTEQLILPATIRIAFVLCLLLLLLTDVYDENLTLNGLLSGLEFITWMLFFYAGLVICVHRQKQIINPISYDGISFRFVGTVAELFWEGVCIPCVLLVGAWCVYRYLEVPPLYRLCFGNLLLFFSVVIGRFLFDKFRIIHTYYGKIKFIFDANLVDYLKYHLKVLLLFFIFSELLVVYVYSINGLRTFSLAAFAHIFEIGFFMLLCSYSIYCLLAMKIEYNNILFGHISINGNQLKSSMKTNVLINRAWTSLKELFGYTGKYTPVISQQFTLYQFESLYLQKNPAVTTAQKASILMSD